MNIRLQPYEFYPINGQTAKQTKWEQRYRRHPWPRDNKSTEPVMYSSLQPVMTSRDVW